MLDPRPDLTPALEGIVERLCAAPPFNGIEPREILVVALGAHDLSAASVRPLPASVRVAGARRRIELGLRPPFFFEGDAPRRVATLVHELLHIDPRAKGRLLAENRHSAKSHAALEREARAIARDVIDCAEPTLFACLAHDGEVLLRAWRHRPVDKTRRVYTDADVFLAPVRMITPPKARAGWW